MLAKQNFLKILQRIERKNSMSLYAVEMLNITKKFGTFIANQSIHFRVQQGMIHALLGENGAGKSTLMNVLTGIYTPNTGEIQLHGQPVQFRTPMDALGHGIGMVAQHSQLIPSMTVLENILLGEAGLACRQIGFWKSLSKRFLTKSFLNKTLESIMSVAQAYGISISPHKQVRDLSIGEQQRVELLKVLYRKAQILILDEPTTMLTLQEVQQLFQMLQNLQEKGHTIIFITHKLQEVLNYTQSITVLRKGQVVAEFNTAMTDANTLAKAMVGETQTEQKSITSSTQTTESLLDMAMPLLPKKMQPLLDVKQVSLRKTQKQALTDIHFSVYPGEILGIAGVAGNGQDELAQALAGLCPISKGTIELNGEEIQSLSCKERIQQAKIAYVPADRLGEAVSQDMSIAENFLLKTIPHQREFLFHWSKYNPCIEKDIREFEIQCQSKDMPARYLSGGNLQRLILARELRLFPQLLIAVYPTRGLDWKATRFVLQLFHDLKAQNKGILYMADDLDELYEISDRILVLYQGQIMGIVPTASADRTQIGLWMAGAERKEIL